MFHETTLRGAALSDNLYFELLCSYPVPSRRSGVYSHRQQEEEDAGGVCDCCQVPPGPDEVAQSCKEGDANRKHDTGQRPWKRTNTQSKVKLGLFSPAAELNMNAPLWQVAVQVDRGRELPAVH